MKKMFLLTTALLLTISMMLAACAPASAPATAVPVMDKPTVELATKAPEQPAMSAKLEFLTGTGIDSDLYKVYQELTAKFIEANPGVEIELAPSSTDHEGEIKTRLASGNIPDIWMTHGWSVGRYGSFLVPLEDQVWAKDLNPALKPVMVSKDGHLYAFPIDVDIAGMLYNEDVLTEAGVKVENIKTWDDFMAACDAIKAKGKTPIYNAGKDRWPTGLYVDWIVPGAMTDATYADLLAGKFTPNEYGKALELVAKFRDAGYFNPDYSSATTDDISLALAKGETGFSFLMNFVAVSAYTYKPDAKIGFMPIPAFAGGKPYFVSGEKNALGIWKDGKNVDVAKAYIAFLAQPENLLKLATSTGSAAGLTTVTVDLGGLSKSFELTATTPTVPYFDRVYMPNGAWDSIVATTEGVLTAQMTYKEAIAKITEDFNSLYKAQKK